MVCYLASGQVNHADRRAMRLSSLGLRKCLNGSWPSAFTVSTLTNIGQDSKLLTYVGCRTSSDHGPAKRRVARLVKEAAERGCLLAAAPSREVLVLFRTASLAEAVHFVVGPVQLLQKQSMPTPPLAIQAR